MGRSIQTWPAGCGVLLSLCVVTLVHSVIGANYTFCDTYGMVPGLGKLNAGLDITTFDLLPRKIPYDQKMKHPFFDFTCNEKKFWAFGIVNFDLPDQIASVITVPGGTATLHTSLSKNDSEVREYMNVNAGVSGGLKAFSFSASASYKKSVETITRNERYSQDVSSFTSATRAEFLPSYELEKFINKKALAEIAKLTKPYKEDRTEYDNFIKKYGTHYVSSAHFGGLLNLKLETKKDYLSKKSDTEIEAQAEAAYGALISVKLGIKTTSNKFSSEFKESTKKKTDFYGGNSNVLEKDGWQKWQPSVFYQPFMIKTQLVPISDIFKDKKKRENMEMAVEQHVLRSFLLSLIRKLHMVKERLAKSAPNYLPGFKVITKRLNEENRKEYLTGDILKKLSENHYLNL